MPKFFVNVRIEAWGSECVEADSIEEARAKVIDEGEFRFCERREADADGGIDVEIDVDKGEDDDE